MTQIQNFVENGFLKVENAFPKEVASTCRKILWDKLQLNPKDPDSWKQPVIRIGELDSEPFKKAANTPVLIDAFRQLAHDNWIPRNTLGSFPIRFPSKQDPEDTGWHVDASFPGDDPNDFFKWKINIYSRGRALLMLFLFSDVSEQDAPTRIKVGSHLDVAKILVMEGKEGLSFMELAGKLNGLPEREVVTATGEAGTVYLCHPFLVHAAQPHRGKSPKFMAQPPLLSRYDFDVDKPLEKCCPIEWAIIKGTGLGEPQY